MSALTYFVYLVLASELTFGLDNPPPAAEPACFSKPDVRVVAPGGGYAYEIGACEAERQQGR